MILSKANGCVFDFKKSSDNFFIIHLYDDTNVILYNFFINMPIFILDSYCNIVTYMLDLIYRVLISLRV